MCGIFATTRPTLWRPLLDSITASMRHRGPDGSGVWTDASGHVLFVQTRLAILGLGPAGDQPRVGENGSVLVFNGELYNFRELAITQGWNAELSDTAVFHRVLQDHQSSSLAECRGMWAYVCYDPAQGVLVYGRDSYGIKPLYILRHPSGGITLASELSTLRLHPDGQELDHLGLRRYLALGHTGPAATAYKNISKVAKGHHSRVQISPSGQLGCITNSVVGISRDAPSGISLDESLAASVKRHVVSDVPLGIFLSGGVDSTLLATYAREEVSPLQSFTVAFPGSPYDESAIAAVNAKTLGLDHTEIAADASSLLEAASVFLRVHGEPLGDPAIMPLVLLARAAAGSVKVVLGGEGADELFGGYARYRVSQLRDDHLLLRPLGALGTALGSKYWGYRRGDNPRLRGLHALLTREPWRAHLLLLGSELPLMSRRSGSSLSELADELRTGWKANSITALSSYEVARRTDQQLLLTESYLEKTDRATMAAGLEARVPFLDPDVALAAARANAAGVRLKAELRALLKRRMPQVRLPGQKLGLTVQVANVMNAGLRQRVDYALKDRDSLLHDLVSARERRWLEFRTERSDITAFRIGMFGLWQQSVVEA